MLTLAYSCKVLPKQTQSFAPVSYCFCLTIASGERTTDMENQSQCIHFISLFGEWKMAFESTFLPGTRWPPWCCRDTSIFIHVMTDLWFSWNGIKLMSYSVRYGKGNGLMSDIPPLTGSLAEFLTIGTDNTYAIIFLSGFFYLPPGAFCDHCSHWSTHT